MFGYAVHVAAMVSLLCGCSEKDPIYDHFSYGLHLYWASFNLNFQSYNFHNLKRSGRSH